MTRSAQALERRAAKRNVSIKEQRVKDCRARKTKRQDDSRMKEPGAWRCPACGNHNFASRRTCHSATCSQQQPSQSKSVVRREQGAADAADVHKEQRQRRRQERQAASWKIPQANAEKLASNRQLRQRYLADDAQLTPEERERAKVLLARDERKRLKKQQQRQKGGHA